MKTAFLKASTLDHHVTFGRAIRTKVAKEMEAEAVKHMHIHRREDAKTRPKNTHLFRIRYVNTWGLNDKLFKERISLLKLKKETKKKKRK